MKHVYKVVPVGNGDLYGWNEYDENGAIVRSSEQHYPSAMDAEKAIRTLAPSDDMIEVTGIHNINPEANLNVNLVKKADESDPYHGMTRVDKSIEDLQDPTPESGKAAKGRGKGLMESLGKGKKTEPYKKNKKSK